MMVSHTVVQTKKKLDSPTPNSTSTSAQAKPQMDMYMTTRPKD